MKKNYSNWICCQIGAREHYAIPRALNEQEKLAYLITDAWVSPSSPFTIFPITGFRERFHPDLAQVKVYSFNSSLIAFEATQKVKNNFGWERIIARNHWFQKQAINKLVKLNSKLTNSPILFSYSYAALELFRFAKKQGWYTVLGQIDPGLWEEKVVIQEHEKYPQYAKKWQTAPLEYWQIWEEECKLADAIVVNSHWSRQLLEKSGVSPNKLQVVPLVYTPPEKAKNFIRTYPTSYNQERPLRVLFLGQVILRKGIASVLESIKLLEGLPIEFWIVGSQQIEITSYFQSHTQVRWVGHVNRSEAAKYYQLADIFLFPTLSDGFGITQLEAQTWQLPIIASRNCGEVVVDGVNGWILPEVSGEAIANLLRICLDHPEKLTVLSKNSQITNKFTLATLAEHLLNL
ncbi:glycosyl transferase group 1 [Richelia sinica FACHB-800]|uniref:Glycosyl transferase group 1 n=1 Tax=Richelia sinica FACHB-800 TaxID=1357546 RepID=A0A975T6N7_9NOST|nr:glycosyltransferase family 4 protein [Richelia sinica]MBD2666128.1 glycosyltransferase family 4 protein [Richelia sinica FACHB-800]QXE23122.1 glycosyl transferase group 1 [Richelia sinica FACHB-800]